MGTEETVKPEAAPAKVRRKMTKSGVVKSNKMDKTVVVSVQSITAHPTYKRSLRRSKSFLAHDPQGNCSVGDRVVISESRPLSRRKRWRVVSIIQKARLA